MTAVASPPSFQALPRSTWAGGNGHQAGLSNMSTDEVSRIFMPRKSLQRTPSSSSTASSSSTSTAASSASASSTASSTSTLTGAAPSNGILPPASAEASGRGTRKKAGRSLWPGSRVDAPSSMLPARSHSIVANGAAAAASTAMSPSNHNSATPILPSQHNMTGSQPARPNGTAAATDGNAMLSLLPINATFERKTIGVPRFPDVLRIGRQTNAKTLPTPVNGFFDSKVLSRQHAEIWSDTNGKIWIRDVKSSNGTFVNGKRLSAENRDSEPHELKEKDTLELGIDIVSEDQKTIVHHKVAARVEHAGFYSASNSVLDLNFGDLESSAYSQNGLGRGRSGSQGSVSSNGRSGAPASVAGSHMNGVGQPKHMNFWLTPVTMEQIVNRLTAELRAAKSQSMELQSTNDFFDTLVANAPAGDGPAPPEAHAAPEATDGPTESHVNGGAVQPGSAPFAEPPAPPPQLPLPEKPDGTRDSPASPPQPVLKRADTERPAFQLRPTTSPLGASSPTQVMSLMDALAAARTEIECQSARVQNLEGLLQEERIARQTAEARSEQLEREKRVLAGVGFDPGVSRDAFQAGSGSIPIMMNGVSAEPSTTATEAVEAVVPGVDGEAAAPETGAAEQSAARLQQRLDLMVLEMSEMKQTMERYRQRAEHAEHESASTRQSLAEMVEKIRRDTAARDRAGTKSKKNGHATRGSWPAEDGHGREPALAVATTASTLASDQADLANGKAFGPDEVLALEQAVSSALAQSRSRQDQLLQSAPYASILGVVVLGMGVMALLNGWQKIDR